MGNIYQITHRHPEDYPQIAQHQVLLLYPRTPHRTAYLAYLMQHGDGELVYHRAAAQQETMTAWLTSLTAHLQSGWGGLTAGITLDAPIEDVAGAIGQHLNNFQSQINQDVFLYLDELDHLIYDDTFNTFFAVLVDTLVPNVHLIINARVLRVEPWIEFLKSGKATVLGTETQHDDLMLSVTEQNRPSIEVYALGRGYALANGSEIDTWDGALPRNLFFFFMDNPLVTRDQIFEIFWPNLNIKEATNVFHVTKRKISERISVNIGVEGNYELTMYNSGFYKPSHKLTRYYDVHQFEEAVKRSETSFDDDDTRELLQYAINLYQGPFLEGGKMPWMHDRQQQLRQRYAQALIGMGRIEKSESNDMTALGFFIRALKETPEREDIHREVMSLYANNGMHEQARDQYATLERHLKTTLNITPSKESRELFASLST